MARPRIPPEARDPPGTLLRKLAMVVFPTQAGRHAPFQMGWRHRQLEKDRFGHISRLDNYQEVEIMVVARPLRGAEGMGAATVGPGERNTTYTGVRGPEAPRGRVDDESVAPGVDPEDRDPTGLMGVKLSR